MLPSSGKTDSCNARQLQLGLPRTRSLPSEQTGERRSTRKRWRGCRILLLNSIFVLRTPASEQRLQHADAGGAQAPSALLGTWNSTNYHLLQSGCNKKQHIPHDDLNRPSLASRSRQTRTGYWFRQCILDHSLHPYILSHSKHL